MAFSLRHHSNVSDYVPFALQTLTSVCHLRALFVTMVNASISLAASNVNAMLDSSLIRRTTTAQVRRPFFSVTTLQSYDVHCFKERCFVASVKVLSRIVTSLSF